MNESELLLETRRFRVVRRYGETDDGTHYAHETIEHPGAVTILPVLDGNRICLIRNYRLAVDSTLIELPAGTLEPGEEPAETARRELVEETGYTAAHIEPLVQFYMSPGIMDERMYLYVATGLMLGDRDLDATEQIETMIVDWPQAMEMIARGEIQDAKTLVGLLHGATWLASRAIE